MDSKNAALDQLQGRLTEAGESWARFCKGAETTRPSDIPLLIMRARIAIRDIVGDVADPALLNQLDPDQAAAIRTFVEEMKTDLEVHAIATFSQMWSELEDVVPDLFAEPVH